MSKIILTEYTSYIPNNDYISIPQKYRDSKGMLVIHPYWDFVPLGTIVNIVSCKDLPYEVINKLKDSTKITSSLSTHINPFSIFAIKKEFYSEACLAVKYNLIIEPEWLKIIILESVYKQKLKRNDSIFRNLYNLIKELIKEKVEICYVKELSDLINPIKPKNIFFNTIYDRLDYQKDLERKVIT